jgi:hypothetical protein
MKIRKRWVASSSQPLHFAPLTRCRYSEFEDLHQKLVQTFPHAVSSMPQFPPKSIICKSHASLGTPPAQSARIAPVDTNVYELARFRSRFLERRKNSLSFYLKFVSLRVALEALMNID